jgi:hypothetical protein
MAIKTRIGPWSDLRHFKILFLQGPEGYFEYGNFEFENGNFEKQSGELKTKWGTKNKVGD